MINRISSCPGAITRALLPFMAATLVGMACAAPAQARVDTIVYFMPKLSTASTYLITWDSGAYGARVTSNSGGIHAGSYVDDGRQRVLTLREPFSYEVLSYDSCDEEVPMRYDTGTLIFRPLSGTPLKGETEFSNITTLTVLAGCDAGQVTTFGSLDAPGYAVANLDMDKRPGMADFKPGRRWAGLSPDAYDPAYGYVASGRDVAQMVSGGQVRFESAGLTVPARPGPGGWLLLDLPGYTRGYTRLTKDAVTGQEVWLEADFAHGVPQWVMEVDMVRVADDASFGSQQEAARVWRSALDFSGPLEYWLNPNGAGSRVSYDQDGAMYMTPVTWSLNGDIDIRRDLSSYFLMRSWTPLARFGDLQWVMEREVLNERDGTVSPYIPARVMYYVDRGPAGAGAAKAVAASASTSTSTRANRRGPSRAAKPRMARDTGAPTAAAARPGPGRSALRPNEPATLPR